MLFILFVQLHLWVHPGLVHVPVIPLLLCPLCLHAGSSLLFACLDCLSGWPLPSWFIFVSSFAFWVQILHVWQEEIWEDLYKKNQLERKGIRKCTIVAFINKRETEKNPVYFYLFWHRSSSKQVNNDADFAWNMHRLRIFSSTCWYQRVISIKWTATKQTGRRRVAVHNYPQTKILLKWF